MNCWLNSFKRKHSFSGALADQTRPVQFELCIWGQAEVWTWGARVVRSRATGLKTLVQVLISGIV